MVSFKAISKKKIISSAKNKLGFKIENFIVEKEYRSYELCSLW